MEKLRKNTAALEKKQKKSFFNFAALCFRNVFYTDVIAKVFRQKTLITKNIVPLCPYIFCSFFLGESFLSAYSPWEALLSLTILSLVNWGKGNFRIFLSLRFYVKSILENLEVLKLLFCPFLGL